MKIEKNAYLVRFCGGFIFVLAAAFCTMGALITAFSFPVDIWRLFGVWLVFALLLTALATRLRVKGILTLTPPVLAAVLWMRTEIAEGGKWAAFSISSEFNNWLDVPVLFDGAEEHVYYLTLFLAVAGVLLTFLLSFSVCLRRSTLFTAILTLPPVLLTFILLDFPPDTRFLVGLLAVYLSMLICSALHPDDFIKRGRAAFPAIAFAALFLGVTYFVAPPESYRRIDFVGAANIQLRIAAERLGLVIKSGPGIGWPVLPYDNWQFNTDYVSVSGAGARAISNRELLEITASHPGVFYLRGYSMQRFDGNTWLDNSADRVRGYGYAASEIMPAYIAYSYYWNYPENAPTLANMTVARTGDNTDIVYIPYYTDQTGMNISIINEAEASYPPNQAEDYIVEFLYSDESIISMASKLEEEMGYSWSIPPSYREGIVEAYTQIEASTAEGLLEIAEQAGITPVAGQHSVADRAAIADQVARLISSSAQYTLSPRPIPDDEDFVLYFLQTSQRGYCIHFATAATLMLRALDVPARFTSGFLVPVSFINAGNSIVITDAEAHAWVEVYYDDIGWMPLEVTPSSPDSGIPASGISHSPQSESLESWAWLEEDYFEDWDLMYGVDEQLPLRSGTSAEQTGQERDYTVVTAAAIIVLLCAGFALRRRIAVKSREKAFSQADTNAAVLCAWRYITRLCGRKPPPESIEEIALKARFSLHYMSGDELAAVVGYANEMAESTSRNMNIFGRFWLKYVRGL